jgi:integrase
MSIRKRGGRWHYQFMIAGQRYYGVFPDAETKTDAKILEAEEQRKVRRGERSTSSPGQDRFETFTKEVFLNYSKENKASWKHDEFRARMLCENFGGKRFSEITVMMVVRFIKTRLASKVKRYRQCSPATRTRSAVTVSKEVTLLSSIFTMAMREKVATENPVANLPRTIRRLLPARRRRRCVIDDQRESQLIEKGLKGRQAYLRPIVLFDLNTGLRLGELRHIEREHVNLEPDSKWFEIDGESWEVPRGCFIITKSKNGKPRVIPLNSQAWAISQHQLEDATIERYLFISSKTKGMIKEVRKGFEVACKKAGIKYGQYEADGVTFHTLRHRFSSKLAAQGVSRTVRRDLLGHKSTDITDDYTHSTIEQRRQAVELLCHTQRQNVVEMPPNCGRIVATA